MCGKRCRDEIRKMNEKKKMEALKIKAKARQRRRLDEVRALCSKIWVSEMIKT